MISEKKVVKKRELGGHQSDDILPETDQAEEFQAKMDGIKGFNLDGIGGAPWDARKSSSSTSARALENAADPEPDPVPPRKKPKQ